LEKYLNQIITDLRLFKKRQTKAKILDKEYLTIKEARIHNLDKITF